MLEHREAECQRPIPLALSRFLSCGFQFAAKPLEAAAEQIVLAAVVGVKSCAANVGLVDDLLRGYGIVPFAHDQPDQGLVKRSPRAGDAPVDLSFHSSPLFPDSCR